MEGKPLSAPRRSVLRKEVGVRRFTKLKGEEVDAYQGIPITGSWSEGRGKKKGETNHGYLKGGRESKGGEKGIQWTKEWVDNWSI